MASTISPKDEHGRLAALRSYAVMDTPPEQALDDLTQLAAHICEAPIALISLMDGDRQWFKSKVGMEADGAPCEIPFCTHALNTPDIFTVRDATKDSRFAKNPLVKGEAHIRFYAGVPLLTPDGAALGTLCVIDRKPRTLDASQERALRALARQVMAHLEMRRQARQLAECEERLRLVTENARVGLVVLDTERRYVFANHAYAELLGLNSSELTGRKVADVLGTQYSYEEQVRPRLDRAFAGEQVAYERQILASGADHWLAVRCEPRKANGVVTHVVLVVTDITERKDADARFRHLVDSNVQGVMFWKEDERIIEANDAFLRIIGYTHRDLEGGGLPWSAISTQEFAELDRRAKRDLAERGTCAPYETEYMRKDGSHVPVLIGAATFGHNRREGVCFVLDLTERKKLEQQYFRAQRMESMGTLASGVAHDLNNILCPILMVAPILRQEMPADQRDSIVSTIEMSAQRGAQIIRQVLTFGRGIEGDKSLVRVSDLLDEMLQIIRGTFPKNIAVESSLGPDLWPVLGDATQLHQVLLNLCVNARDAMPNGGSLRLSAVNFEMDAHYASMLPEATPGAHVLFEVGDTGSGIAPATLERIFDPFFTTKEIGKGTGLGLSTAHGIIKSHGGFLKVASALGKGTTFQIWLPAAFEESTTLAEIPSGASHAGNGEVVLVVDDEPTVTNAARAVLEVNGYHVLLAAEGTEALAVFAQNLDSIAIVITDLMMPHMNGVTLIRALGRMKPDIRIIASTGLGEKANLPELNAMGVATILHKPYDALTLLRAVHSELHPCTDETAGI